MPPDTSLANAKIDNIVCLAWSVDKKLLLPELPKSMTLDLWNGKGLVFIQAMQVSDYSSKVMGINFHDSFPMISLRFCTYSNRTGAKSSVAIRTLIPGKLRSWRLNSTMKEKASSFSVKFHQLEGVASETDTPRTTLFYEWKREGIAERILALITTPPRKVRNGSIESFITDRYPLHTSADSARSYSPLAECFFEVDVRTLFGAQWESPLTEVPLISFASSMLDIDSDTLQSDIQSQRLEYRPRGYKE